MYVYCKFYVDDSRLCKICIKNGLRSDCVGINILLVLKEMASNDPEGLKTLIFSENK